MSRQTGRPPSLWLSLAGALLVLFQELPTLAEAQTRPGSGDTRSDAPKDVAKTPRTTAADICRTLAQAAANNDLPVEFFTRLIWQESRFNPEAVSSKGAQGIAQFMPETASARGLTNPFEPLQALREAASYLRELRITFRGNLGLAAAAYNAGPGRVEAWLAGQRGLPDETRAYVRIVTGHAADAWASQSPPPWKPSDISKGVPRTEIARSTTTVSRPLPPSTPYPAWALWGVQLAGNWSEDRVLATYEQLRRRHRILRDRLPLVLRTRFFSSRGAPKFIVRVSEHSRAGAEALCAKLRADGGACVVLRNPRT